MRFVLVFDFTDVVTFWWVLMGTDLFQTVPCV